MSDYVSITCSILSAIIAIVGVIVAIIVGYFQMKQGKRMEVFEKRQDERDEKRHEGETQSQVRTFISKYSKCIGLLPLCAIASMYDDTYSYTREMYQEFCHLTVEVQNKILKRQKLDFYIERDAVQKDAEEDSFFYKCIAAITDETEKRYPDDRKVFYDGGKYIRKCLTNWGSKKIPKNKIKYQKKQNNPIFSNIANETTSPYETCIQDTLDDTSNQNKISYLMNFYNFDTSEEIDACHFAAILAQCIAIRSINNNEADAQEYGCPGEYNGEDTIDTMEDIFLETLYEIYVNLIVKEINHKNH